MKIRDLCRRNAFTDADRCLIETFPDRDIELLTTLVPDDPSFAQELERRRRQRRKQRQLAVGPGEIGSPPPNEVATVPSAAPAADAGGNAGSIAAGGPLL